MQVPVGATGRTEITVNLVAEDGALLAEARAPLVIQEAAAAGLGVICSDECGAGDVFVQQGINGIIVPTGSVAALAGAMRTFSESRDLLDYAPNASFDMAKRLMPSSFAETVIPFIQKKRQFVS